MKTPDEHELIDKAMAGRLSAEERLRWEQLLAARPELALDLQIGEALRVLPKPPPVSTNFTSLVLQAVHRPQPPAPAWHDWLRFPRLARLAGAAVLICGVGLFFLREQDRQRQTLADLARSVAVLGEPKPDELVTVFKDFEAIRNLPAAASEVDYGLLAALRADP